MGDRSKPDYKTLRDRHRLCLFEMVGVRILRRGLNFLSSVLVNFPYVRDLTLRLNLRTKCTPTRVGPYTYPQDSDSNRKVKTSCDSRSETPIKETSSLVPSSTRPPNEYRCLRLGIRTHTITTTTLLPSPFTKHVTHGVEGRTLGIVENL